MLVRLGIAMMLAYSSAAATQFAIATDYSQSADSKSARIRTAAPNGPTIVGVASTYNPYQPGTQSGGTETASGEPYDPSAWTAAIKTDLREQFGGVGYGTNYRPTFALVESAGKHAIVKINDVGPLKPGRVIDFAEQTMRYFDPSMELGLIDSVKVTPLLGDDWTTGPVEG
jgi:rare lipoprotein A